MRRNRFVDLAVDHSDVGFDVFNAAELHLQHESMMCFDVASQREHEFVELLSKPPARKLGHLLGTGVTLD
jgi:hypothetical protein